MKKWCGFLCMLLCSLTVFAGCGLLGQGNDSHYTADGRPIVRVSMINDSSYPLWRAHVESRCSGIRIQWENNRNAVQNVLYQAHHEDIPDIIVIRRFESDTTAQLQPYLADLRDLPLAAQYMPQYLEPFARNGGQYWLPGPGVFDGIVANTDLFRQYGIALPNNRQSFLQACKALDDKGIKAFAMDYGAPWTPVQMLEGFGLAYTSGNEEAQAWWRNFAQGRTDAVEPKIFEDAANQLRILTREGILREEDLQMDAAAMDRLLVHGQAAMVRKVSDEVFDPTNANHCAALPFFGENEQDNCLYTYPVFAAAMSKKMSEDAVRRKAGEQVLNAMLDESAQQVLNQNGMGLISYYKDYELPLSSAMKNVEPLIQANKCFIRILNSNSFSAAADAFRKLIQDDVSNEEFIQILNRNLFQAKEAVKIGNSNISASNRLNSILCSPSASVISQTVQAQTGVDCVLMDAREALMPIYSGAYFDEDISSIAARSTVYIASLQGKELEQLVDSTIFYATTFEAGKIEPLLTYPAAAGLSIHLQKDGTVQKLLFGDGTPVQDSGMYQVAVSAGVYKAMQSKRNPLLGVFVKSTANLQSSMSAYFSEKGRWPVPVDYFVVVDPGEER